MWRDPRALRGHWVAGSLIVDDAVVHCHPMDQKTQMLLHRRSDRPTQEQTKHKFGAPFDAGGAPPFVLRAWGDQ